MSKSIVWTMVASLAMATALCISDARAQYYLGAEGGWTGLADTRDRVDGVTIKRSFDGGFNVGARGGYQMGPWRFEGEFSHRGNTGNITRFATRFNGSVDTNSLMFNGIYDFNVGWAVTPHVGLGLGFSQLDASLDAPVLGYRSKSSDVLFSYQPIVGFRYMINPALAFDLDYRYKGSSDATYHARAFTLGGVAVPARTYSGTVNSHNVVASLSWLFAAPAPPPPPQQFVPPPPPPPAPRPIPGVRG